MEKTFRIEIGRPAWDGRVGLFCRNEETGAEHWKIYKTMAAARAAATRFENAALAVGYWIVREEA